MKQRPIKFRAWDAFNEEMYYSDDDLVNFFRKTALAIEGDNEVTIEQFTGLHDLNGKEIYIGDKIKDMLTLAEYEVKEGFCKRYAFIGIYCENNHQQVQLNADSDTDKNSQIEVIGNIHEK